MKIIRHTAFWLIVLLTISCSQKAENHNNHDHANHDKEGAVKKTKSKSPKSSAMAMVGGNHIHIDYSSPRVRGRQIFGGLVAYDEVWVTGAHRATSISFDKDVMIEGKHIPKGKYGFFTIPSKEKWTVILNKQWDMHLADDYNPKDDILRFEVKSETLGSPSEELTYKVESENNMATISMAWADVKISFQVKNH